MKSDDLREELLSVKKAHQLTLRENAQCRTRLRIAERECRRRETEIERMLSQPQRVQHGSAVESRMEVAALRRKVLLYERMLHEKTAENEKLLTDKSVAQAADTRKIAAKLENECQRLRTHLAQSVPESEFLREKEQYMAIINRLVEENMHLRSVIGEFEQRRKESERIISQLGGSDALIRQFRHTTISSRKQANFYRKALSSLLKSHRKTTTARGKTESMVVHSQATGRERLEESTGGGRERRAPSVDSLLEEAGRRTPMTQGVIVVKKDEDERMGGRGREEEKTTEEQMPRRSLVKMYPDEEEKDDGDDDEVEDERPPGEAPSGGVVVAHQSRSSSAPPESTPRVSPFSPSTDPPSSASPRKKRKGGSSSGGRKEDDEEDNDALNNEGQLVEASHLNALYRVLHSHLLRQQMFKVRRERDNNTSHYQQVGMIVF